MKNINVHHYLFLSETYEPVARDTCTPPPPPPPLWQNFKKLDFCDIYLELPLFNTTKPYER